MRRPIPAVSQGKTGTFTEHKPSDGLSDILRGGEGSYFGCWIKGILPIQWGSRMGADSHPSLADPYA
jgi:hypothetical protein